MQESNMTEYLDTVDLSGNFPIQSNDMTEYFDPEGFSIEEDTMTQNELIQEPTMIEQFELAQGSRGRLPAAEYCRGRVLKLRSVQPAESPIDAEGTEFDRCRFIKLSSESFPDLEGPQLEFLNDLRLTAHRSEEFFLSVSSNQWVRTAVSSDRAPQELFCLMSTVEERSKLISSIVVHSNVLPRDPFWTKLQSKRDGESKRVHFPCSILKDALQEEKTLMVKMLEWREKSEECELGLHRSKRSVDGDIKEDLSRLFWEILVNGEDQDCVKPIKQFAQGADGYIWLVTWRGGLFVRKDRVRPSNNNDDSDPRDFLDKELDVVEKLSHPHIVYSFGVSFAAKTSSLFMEYMQSDLYTVIIDRIRRDSSKPPFSHQDSIDILLQIAKAMAHIHSENLVHGDLKSQNILISEFWISEDVKHYLVKVADFGSAQSVTSNSGSTDFQPGPSTTNYAAPEVLKRRVDKSVLICHPKFIDVYSFAIVAFEVLTGEEPYGNIKSKAELKRGIIEGIVRPPLRAECRKEKFLREERLISLIESCWHGDPSERPSFSKIVDVLNSVRVQILKPSLRSALSSPRSVLRSLYAGCKLIVDR